MSYLHTGFTGCSVGSGISCGTYKLARTPRVIKKYIYIGHGLIVNEETKKKNYETGKATRETRGLRLCLGQR
jgi:hypothetical protein